jgi:DNA polymerase-3 subunit gamma/tau
MDFGTVQRLWPDVVEAVKQKSRATWMTIMSGVQPVSLDGKVLTLGFDAEGRRLGFVNGGRDAVLREVFKERMGVDWRIETVVGGGGGAVGGRLPGQGSGGGGRAAGGNGGGFGSAQSSGFGSGGAAPGGFGGAPEAQAQRPVSQQSRPANPVPRPASGGGPARQADPGPMAPPPDEPPPPPEPAPVDESDEVDPEGDADADGTEAEMSGMALIQRELGGQIIREIDNSNPQ